MKGITLLRSPNAVLLAACAIAGLLAGCESDDPCQIALRRHLKAPMTAKVSMTYDNEADVERFHASNPTSATTRAAGGWVDAQNPMGVYLRSAFVCEDDASGLVRIAFVERPPDVKGWISEDPIPWGLWEKR